jgi:hypothetical protein
MRGRFRAVNGRIAQQADATVAQSYFGSGNALLGVLLCISGLLNFVLLGLMAYARKKRINAKRDPSEESDFEIEILE